MGNKICPNPECRADNPAGAKFCRKCGTAFTPVNRFKQMFSSAIAKMFAPSSTAGASTFTLDIFSNIAFQPVSVVKIRFVNRFVVFLCVCCLLPYGLQLLQDSLEMYCMRLILGFTRMCSCTISMKLN